MNRLFFLIFLIISLPCFSQPNYNVTDVERSYKEAKELFIKEQFSLAFPLLKELKRQYPDNTQSNHTYLNQDVDYYYIVCGLKLDQPVAEVEAKNFTQVAHHEPRQQIMSYRIAR